MPFFRLREQKKKKKWRRVVLWYHILWYDRERSFLERRGVRRKKTSSQKDHKDHKLSKLQQTSEQETRVSQ